MQVRLTNSDEDYFSSNDENSNILTMLKVNDCYIGDRGEYFYYIKNGKMFQTNKFNSELIKNIIRGTTNLLMFIPLQKEINYTSVP